MKFPVAYRVFASINLLAFLLMLLQSIILVTNPRLGLVTASVSIVASAWLLIASFMWFFGSRYSYPLLYLTALVIMATVGVVFTQSFAKTEANASSDILIHVFYGAIPFIYSVFLILSLFFGPAKEWAKTVGTTHTHTLCTMPRDRFGASNIGTFACPTFPRDTKASKRANLFHATKRGVKGGRLNDFKFKSPKARKFTTTKLLLFN